MNRQPQLLGSLHVLRSTCVFLLIERNDGEIVVSQRQFGIDLDGICIKNFGLCEQIHPEIEMAKVHVRFKIAWIDLQCDLIRVV